MLARSKIIAILALVLTALVLGGCDSSQPDTPATNHSADAKPATDPLRVIIRTAPVTFWGQPWGIAGLELELAQALAQRLDRPLQTLSIAEDQKIVDALVQGQADIAMASLPELEAWHDRLQFSAPLLDSRFVIVYPASRAPLDLQDIELLNVAVDANTSALAFVQQRPEFAGKIRPYEASDAFDLIHRVASGVVPMVLTQAKNYELVRSIYPNLTITDPVGGDVNLGFAIGKSGDDELLTQANALIGQMQRNGQLENILEKYLPGEPLRPVDESTFDRHIDQRLSLYWPFFLNAGEQTGQDPLLLAAVGYQESHWLRRAKSPTGVRGVMMLTLTTAKEMGVDNRLNAEQSIMGGAKYLKKMRDRLPERITEPDRTYLALAAYNVGYGHLSDARKLAQAMGGDPDKWSDVRKALPLKADKAYYPQTKFGYARGGEPVVYVGNIQNYYNALLVRDTLLNGLAFKEETP